MVVIGFSIVFSDYIMHHSWINLRPLQGLQDELLISLLSLFNEILNGSLPVQLPQDYKRYGGRVSVKNPRRVVPTKNRTNDVYNA